ncbi:MAG: transposase [Alphaproteobacteria bacterium]
MDAVPTRTAYKTAVFRIHDPSRRKRAMLDYALRRAHLAYSRALATIGPKVEAWATEERGAVQRDKESGLDDRTRRRNALQRKRARERMVMFVAASVVRPLGLAGGWDMICKDVVSQVESHVALWEKQEAVGVPTVQRLAPDPEALDSVLGGLRTTTDLNEETILRDRLLLESKSGTYRPILLERNRKSDGFLVLKNPVTNRYFVYLNLCSQNSRFAKWTNKEQERSSCRWIHGLVDMRTGEVMSFRSKTGCLFPIDFGRDYQFDEFIARARTQSAKIVRRGATDDRDATYEVHVTYEFENPAVVPETRLGVDRGIYNLASLTVVDDNGHIVTRENVDGRGLRFVQRALERRQRSAQKKGRVYRSKAKQFAADEAVHIAANRIVELAKANRSLVTLEFLGQLKGGGKRRGRSNFNRLLGRNQYGKLEKVLDYKLAVAGLPKFVEIGAARTSITCVRCGYSHKDNRPKVPIVDGFSMERFVCGSCAYADDADLNASRIIALKGMWREWLPKSQRSTLFTELPETLRFDKFLRDLAERRGEGACDRKVGTFGRPGLDEQHGEGNVSPGIGGLSAEATDPDPDRTPRQEKNSQAMPPAVSSSSGILPPSEVKMDGPPDG